jgi:predicted RNase H-like nuclease (RuvC/YqgF family)
MRIWEEIFGRLRNGEPLEQVRKDYRSASQFAMAPRIFSGELTAEAERKREARKQEEARLKEVEAERKQTAAEKKLLEKDVNELRRERKALAIKVQSLRREADEKKLL